MTGDRCFLLIFLYGGTEGVLFLRDSEIFTKESVMALFSSLPALRRIADCGKLIFPCLLEELLLKERHLQTCQAGPALWSLAAGAAYYIFVSFSRLSLGCLK